MSKTINAKELRARLGEIVSEVRKGGRYTVLYRSRPAFDIVPVDGAEAISGSLDEDPLYQAGPVGASGDGRAARSHDEVVYR